MPPPATTVDDFTHFQDLFKRVATKLKIALEEVPETQHELTDILQMSSSSKIALPINGATMEPARAVSQTPATIPPICKRADRKYYVPSKGSEFLHTKHPTHWWLRQPTKEVNSNISNPPQLIRMAKSWISLAAKYTCHPRSTLECQIMQHYLPNMTTEIMVNLWTLLTIFLMKRNNNLCF